MKKGDSVEEMNRLLKARLEEWRLGERRAASKSKPVITITREPGCGADSIAERLCSELGLHLYDWEVVQQVAKDREVSTQLVAGIEKDPPSEFEDYVAELQGKYALSAQEYLASLKRVLLAIAVPGNAVIVGRGSNFFLPPDRKLGLCFVAPLALRTKNIMKEMGVSENAARKHISRLEAEHRRFVKKYFQADIRDPAQYHLVINTALVKPDVVVQMVKQMIPK